MGIKNEPSHYSEEFKWRVVQEVLRGKHTKEAARKIYGIRKHSAILDWMRTFSGHSGIRAPDSIIVDAATMDRTKQVKELEEQIARLQEELNRERRRADLWQTMVEVAEKDLGIDIKKKPGAQLSKPSGKRR